MTTKGVVNHLSDQKFIISYDSGRAESRVCNTFIKARIPIIYPKNDNGNFLTGPDVGFEKMSC